jgi:16S rRNA C1402 N4-methylase RsmH
LLLGEAIQLLNPLAAQTFVDCTLGRGGHALAIAQRPGTEGLFIGILNLQQRAARVFVDRLRYIFHNGN